MEKITKLTPEQEGRLAEFRDAWLAHGLSTEPANRPEAERGVRLAYEAVGLPAPKIVVWLDSPMTGALGAAMLASGALAPRAVGAQVGAQVGDQVWDQVRDQVWAQVGDQVRDQVRAQVGAQVWAQVGAQVWAQVGDQVRDQVGDQVRDQVWDQVWAQVGDQVRDQVWDQVRDQVAYGRVAWGQHDANWLGFYDYFATVAKLTACDKLAGLNLVAQNAGWWWPFKGAVVLTDRPCRLERDAENRLHSLDGMAIQYRDGWGAYASHGLRVDEQIIMRPETLTAEQILGERNAEIRRVMMERVGNERFAELCQPEVVHADKDQYGWDRRLLRIRVPDDEDFMAVEVINSTPEPDGSRHKYLLRVSPECRPLHTNGFGEPQELTCANAVASSFGLRGEGYNPNVET